VLNIVAIIREFLCSVMLLVTNGDNIFRQVPNLMWRKITS